MSRQVRKSAWTSGWLSAHAEMNRQRMPETAASPPASGGRRAMGTPAYYGYRFVAL